jgi:hypothetical protein
VTEKTGEDFGDPLSREFWEAARQHRLLLQRCDRCGHHQYIPRPFCVSCDADSLRWVESGGAGAIYSVTVTRREVLPDRPVPYVVALVELDEGPRLLANIEGIPHDIGTRVRLFWRDRPDGPPVPAFKPERSD